MGVTLRAVVLTMQATSPADSVTIASRKLNKKRRRITKLAAYTWHTRPSYAVELHFKIGVFPRGFPLLLQKSQRKKAHKRSPVSRTDHELPDLDCTDQLVETCV